LESRSARTRSDPLGPEDKCISIRFVGGVLYLHGTYQEIRDFALAIAAEANRREAQDRKWEAEKLLEVTL
jgi:hypothetical protein